MNKYICGIGAAILSVIIVSIAITGLIGALVGLFYVLDVYVTAKVVVGLIGIAALCGLFIAICFPLSQFLYRKCCNYWKSRGDLYDPLQKRRRYVL